MSNVDWVKLVSGTLSHQGGKKKKKKSTHLGISKPQRLTTANILGGHFFHTVPMCVTLWGRVLADGLMLANISTECSPVSFSNVWKESPVQQTHFPGFFLPDFVLFQRTFISVQFGHSVVSDSLWTHELQHDRPPCLSLTLRVYSNSCPSSRWCYPAISSSFIPFSSCPQSLPT